MKNSHKVSPIGLRPRGFAWLPVLLLVGLVIAVGGVYTYSKHKQAGAGYVSQSSEQNKPTLSAEHDLGLPYLSFALNVTNAAEGNFIDFGDGMSAQLTATYCQENYRYCGIIHGYKNIGTYNARLLHKGEVIATTTVEIEAPAIVGSANAPYVRVYITDLDGKEVYDSGVIPVAHMVWRAPVTRQLQSGSYEVAVYGYANANGTSAGASGNIGSGTLTVTKSGFVTTWK